MEHRAWIKGERNIDNGYRKDEKIEDGNREYGINEDGSGRMGTLTECVQ